MPNNTRASVKDDMTDRNYTNEPSGSETPDVDYFYGTTAPKVGKLTKVSSSVSTTEYTSFDILGRVTASKQTTDGGDTNGYSTGYTYKLSGALDEQTYPSGRVVKNELDASGDLSLVTSKENSSAIYKTYANDFTYTAVGAVSSLKLGNGRFESTAFNSRLQPTQIALGSSVGNAGLLKIDYTYNSSGNNDNNGNLLSQTITVPGLSHPFVQTYTYDELNRLKSATETNNSTQTWKQTFTFDRYGNRRFDEANTTMPTSFSNQALTNPTISTSNNRLTSTGWTYDSAGNTIGDPDGRSFIYDAENKQVEVKNSSNSSIGTYFFDGDGKRVRKYVPATGETTVFVYDAAGKQIAEYSTVVASANDAKVAYLTADHLGSPRVNTDVTGAVTSRHDYHPFGEEIYTSQRTTALAYAADTVRKQFTGYERDGETDLDFAQARIYRNKIGRFLSPDYFINDTNLGSPQSWNLYAYVRNNPLVYTDPSGCEIIIEFKSVIYRLDNVTNSGYRMVTLNGPNQGQVVTSGNQVLDLIDSLGTTGGIASQIRDLVVDSGTHYFNIGENSDMLPVGNTRIENPMNLSNSAADITINTSTDDLTTASAISLGTQIGNANYLLSNADSPGAIYDVTYSDGYPQIIDDKGNVVESSGYHWGTRSQFSPYGRNEAQNVANLRERYGLQNDPSLPLPTYVNEGWRTINPNNRVGLPLSNTPSEIPIGDPPPVRPKNATEIKRPN